MGKLTKRTIDALSPRAKEYTVWDSELRGFGCRVHPGGQKTFVFKYRVGGGRRGTQRKLKLGAHGAGFTVDQARTETKHTSGAVLKGNDPAGDRSLHRQADTLEDFAKRYISDHAKLHKKASSAALDQAMLDRHILPKLGTRKVVDITSDDVRRFIIGHAATPIMSNRLRALLSKMFTLANSWGVRHDPVNPVHSVERFMERSRERFLNGDEIKRLGDALRKAETELAEPWQAVAAIRLRLLTGCRKSEVLSLQWSFVDRDNSLLALPDSKTGRRTVYLTPPVAELLDSLPRTEGCPWVLPGRYEGQGHLIGLNNVWARIRSEAKLAGIRLHDLPSSHVRQHRSGTQCWPAADRRVAGSLEPWHDGQVRPSRGRSDTPCRRPDCPRAVRRARLGRNRGGIPWWPRRGQPGPTAPLALKIEPLQEKEAG
jgi:integrase